MKRALIIYASFVVVGCAELPPAEVGYQLLNAVDTAQTVQIAKSDCYKESETAWLIGEHPSVGGALLLGVANGLIHIEVTKLMREHDWPRWIQVTWQITSIGYAADMVKNNHDQGIGLMETNCE